MARKGDPWPVPPPGPAPRGPLVLPGRSRTTRVTPAGGRGSGRALRRERSPARPGGAGMVDGTARKVAGLDCHSMVVHMRVPPPRHGTSMARLQQVRPRFVGGQERDLHRVLTLRPGPGYATSRPVGRRRGDGSRPEADRKSTGRKPRSSAAVGRTAERGRQPRPVSRPSTRRPAHWYCRRQRARSEDGYTSADDVRSARFHPVGVPENSAANATLTIGGAHRRSSGIPARRPPQNRPPSGSSFPLFDVLPAASRLA